MGAGQQGVEIGQRPEQRIDAAIIADVVAEVLHRRDEERREPDRVDPEADNVVQLRLDPLQIADAVAVGIEKAARIDLVEDRALPPFGVVGRGHVGAFAQRLGMRAFAHAGRPEVNCYAGAEQTLAALLQASGTPRHQGTN